LPRCNTATGLDLGPEGGEGGGRIVAHGTPETIADSPESHTGRFLKPLLPAQKLKKRA
jgi:excinuclease ABC subunit A